MSDQNTPPEEAAGGQAPAGGGGSPPPPPPASAPWYGADMPAELAGVIDKAGYKGLPDVVKSLQHAQSLVGLDKSVLLRLPADQSDPAAWGDVWKALGRPDTVEGYGIKPDPKIGLEGPLLDGFLQAVHGSERPQDLVPNLVKWYGEMATTQAAEIAQAIEGARTQTEAKLKAEWGGAYQQKRDAANAVIRAHGGEDLAKFLINSGVGDDERFVRFVDKIAGMVAEDTLPGEPGRDAGHGALTPAQAQAKVADFRAANEKALTDRTHPDHPGAVKRYEELMRAAYPTPTG
jgi:hypothetical protein